VRIPPALAAEWAHEPEWLAALPGLVADCAEQWSLELEEPVDTPHSLVAPAGDVVLKLNAPSHFEADHEPDALARWDGGGAVRLLARDDERRAFLCERCRPGLRLWDAEVDEPEVAATLVKRLSIVAEPADPFRRLADEAVRWADELPTLEAVEPALLEYALDVLRTVDSEARFLVNQDLHGGNVLSAEREPWLVIDPKPLVGERELDGVGLLRNAAFRGASVAHWLDVLADLGLDRERLRGWGVAHTLAWGSVGAARKILDG
jgi:streptomycin 6-kinase